MMKNECIFHILKNRWIPITLLLTVLASSTDDYINKDLCEGCYQKQLRGVPLLEKMVLLFNKDGMILARHYRNDRADTKEAKFFEHAEDQQFTMMLEVLKYTKDEHVELKWQLTSFTTEDQKFDFIRILASMQILSAAILRGSNLNIEIYDLLHSTLANEIRDQTAKMKMPKPEDLKTKTPKKEPKIGDLTEGLEDPHNAAESELRKIGSSNIVNETLMNGQVLQSNNMKIVDNSGSGSNRQPGLFANGRRLKATADYEYIEQDLGKADKMSILSNLENSLKQN